MLEPIEVLGVFTEKQGDIIGKVLTDGETLEPIGYQGLTEAKLLKQAGMNGKGTAAEPLEPVLDGVSPHSEVPGHVPHTAGGDQLAEQTAVVDLAFCEVVDTEGLGGELSPAAAAEEAAHTAEGEGGVGTASGVPGTVRGREMVVETLRVRAKTRVHRCFLLI
jgi:hypothetical protein